MTLILQPPPRYQDPWGAGHFGASRGDRVHRGVDYACIKESILLSPVKGEVTKLGYPYSDDYSFRYVEVTDNRGYRHRFFYVEPLVYEGNKVKVGHKLGIVQNLQTRYPDITNHVHYEVIDLDGDYLNPEQI